MRNFLKSSTASREQIKQMVVLFFNDLQRNTNLKSLKDFDINNEGHIDEFIKLFFWTIEFLKNRGSSSTASDFYKRYNSEMRTYFLSLEHQWISLLYFMTTVEFTSDDTLDYIKNGIKIAEKNSNKDFIGRVNFFKNLHRNKNDRFYDDFLKQNDDYVILYRGFHTNDDSRIRTSNDKTKLRNYYKQKEGWGYSYTTNLAIAGAFASYLYIENKTMKYGLDIMGRFCIARYVVKKSNIFALYNERNEQEVIVNADKAFLIDYKFISNKNFETSKIKGYNDETILTKRAKNLQVEMEKDKNHWLNKVFSKNFKINKDLKLLLDKS